jgi:ABC-type cobalt transport system substrate-binding protein
MFVFETFLIGVFVSGACVGYFLGYIKGKEKV